MKQKNLGFTIVELLIVIVVIGILAAIVIVAFNGVQNRGYDTSVKSNLTDMAKKLELAKVNDGRYPLPPVAGLNIRISKNAYAKQNNLYYCYDSTTDRYAVQARSVSGQYFKIVDGVVSSGAGPYGYSGENTCDILDPAITWGGSTASLGYDNATTTWAPWAQ